LILEIILYLIFSAIIAKKKKQRKLEERRTPNPPPPTTENVFNLLNAIKKEYRSTIPHEPMIPKAVVLEEPEDLEYSPQPPQEELVETQYEEFERELQSDYAAASSQNYEYEDFDHSEPPAEVSKSGGGVRVNSALKRIGAMPLLKQAILWKEIFGDPVALRREIDRF